ncbi:MAG: hypothetical protein K8H87_08425 [Pseudorhodoplanes sp.]|nr:hypothetical protein [Pseudorhodoplanes sp.]
MKTKNEHISCADSRCTCQPVPAISGCGTRGIPAPNKVLTGFGHSNIVIWRRTPAQMVVPARPLPAYFRAPMIPARKRITDQ